MGIDFDSPTPKATANPTNEQSRNVGQASADLSGLERFRNGTTAAEPIQVAGLMDKFKKGVGNLANGVGDIHNDRLLRKHGETLLSKDGGLRDTPEARALLNDKKSIESIQTRVNNWRADNGKAPIAVDGSFGPGTRRAFKEAVEGVGGSIVNSFGRELKERGSEIKGATTDAIKSGSVRLKPLDNKMKHGVVGQGIAEASEILLDPKNPEHKAAINNQEYIQRTQGLVNEVRKSNGQPPIAVDGQFGPSTAKALEHAKRDIL